MGHGIRIKVQIKTRPGKGICVRLFTGLSQAQSWMRSWIIYPALNRVGAVFNVKYG